MFYMEAGSQRIFAIHSFSDAEQKQGLDFNVIIPPGEQERIFGKRHPRDG
ncbi:UNVERIFIED_CONTAM: hypothetical protein FKN15_050173 [Acipenser sinensis]